MKRTHLIATAMTALFASVSLPHSTYAQSSGEIVETNAEQRINFSGKLRMLSQRIPSAACHLAKNIDPEGARNLLTGAVAEFEQIITALEFGADEQLNIIAPETRRRTLRRPPPPGQGPAIAAPRLPSRRPRPAGRSSDISLDSRSCSAPGVTAYDT